MSIIDAEEWDAVYDVLKAAIAWRKARRDAIADAKLFGALADAEAKLVEEVDYFEKHYGD